MQRARGARRPCPPPAGAPLAGTDWICAVSSSARRLRPGRELFFTQGPVFGVNKDAAPSARGRFHRRSRSARGTGLRDGAWLRGGRQRLNKGGTCGDGRRVGGICELTPGCPPHPNPTQPIPSAAAPSPPVPTLCPTPISQPSAGPEPLPPPPTCFWTSASLSAMAAAGGETRSAGPRRSEAKRIRFGSRLPLPPPPRPAPPRSARPMGAAQPCWRHGEGAGLAAMSRRLRGAILWWPAGRINNYRASVKKRGTSDKKEFTLSNQNKHELKLASKTLKFCLRVWFFFLAML